MWQILKNLWREQPAATRKTKRLRRHLAMENLEVRSTPASLLPPLEFTALESNRTETVGKNESVVYIGGAGGGVWKTTNGGL